MGFRHSAFSLTSAIALREVVGDEHQQRWKDSRNLGSGYENLTCKPPAELISKYNRIFIPAIVTSINGNKYDQCVNYDGDPENEHQEIIPTCYELSSDISLNFSKTNVYKLDNIPYKE